MNKYMTKTNKVELDITENVMRSLIKSVGLKSFAVALHNTFFNGKVLDNLDDVEDIESQLPEIYKGIDQINRAAGNEVWRDG